MYDDDDDEEDEEGNPIEKKGEQEISIDKNEFLKEQGQEEQMMASKPYKSEIVWPSQSVQPKNPDHAPDANLTLQCVHGFRCFDKSKNMVRYCAKDSIIFCQAAVGVQMDKKRKQTFF